MNWHCFNSRWARVSLAFAVLFIATHFVHEVASAHEHTKNGTKYGNQGVSTYIKMKHGPDGTLFLDPYFLPYLLNLEGQVILDAGCGAGPWSIFAAKNGAVVYGIDIQEGMIEKAKQAAREESVENIASFVVGDVGHLPYPDHFFDRAISVNVGCNLPNLKPHFQELSRVLKTGGVAIITAPTSFGTVFTDGKRSNEEVVNSINQLLISHQDSFPKTIEGLDNVYRATFAKKQDNWVLLLDETNLKSGVEIWRKIPMMVVPNYYHSEHEYVSILIQEGFRINNVYRPYFTSEQEIQSYNENQKHTLSKEYTAFPPFVIFIVEK